MTNGPTPVEPTAPSARRAGPRLAIGAAIGIVLVVAVVIGVLALTLGHSSQTYTIPAGTGARLAQGETVDLMPSEIHISTGDRIVIRNEDDRPYEVGPIAVRANETVEHRFNVSGTYVGQCALQTGGSITIVVD